MMVSHNLLAMNAQRMFGINSKSKAKSTEKLSSGYQVNRAADDAAGLAISEKMRRMIRGLNQGAENTQDGISFVQIGDGAMEEIHEIVHRMTELSVQASNGTLTEEDREYIDQEVQQLKKEINRIADATTFNEIPVFDNNAVTFGLQGSPNDLQIFDATYDDNGNIATYGGFLFHGERITWDMIDSGMVTTDANGKQAFKGGEYAYTSDQTGYSFTFSCEKGSVPPVITREISIEADSKGVYLGKELFDWSKVYDTDGNALDTSNLHAGPWAIDYYGSKFMFTVSEPIVDIEDFAKDIDSCKNSAVYYNWEVYYSEGAGETAVDVLHNTVKVSPNNDTWRVTQDTAYSMARDVDAQQTSGLVITVRADENGIWLEDLQQNTVAGSMMTWQDFGITSWEEGMEIPGLSNGSEVTYTYKDSSGSIGLTFQFELSDITSMDSVLDGLDGMKVQGWPGTVNYDPTVNFNSVAGSDVKGITCTDSNLFLGFYEERAEQRNFDVENWSTTSDTVSYSNGVIDVTFDGGFTLSGSTTSAASTLKSTLQGYVGWLESKKYTDIMNGPSTTVTDTELLNDYLQTHAGEGDLALALKTQDYGRTVQLSYRYDYKDIFADLTGKIEMEMVKTSVVASGAAFTYVLQDDGSYRDYTDQLRDLYGQINADNITYPTEDDKDAAKIQAKNDLDNSGKLYALSVTYKDKDGNVSSLQNAINSYNDQVMNDLAQSMSLTITSEEYSRVALSGDEKDNEASRPAYIAFMKETPAEPDIYIVHSSVAGDRTGIPRFAMNTAALGIAFVDCKTAESAEQTLASTKNALRYVSSKRAHYGALQNRLEHTYNNNRNISENTTAAESRIRDTDMSKEMVKYSKDSILQQVGQAMMAQANQSNQGVLSLLN